MGEKEGARVRVRLPLRTSWPAVSVEEARRRATAARAAAVAGRMALESARGAILGAGARRRRESAERETEREAAGPAPALHCHFFSPPPPPLFPSKGRPPWSPPFPRSARCVRPMPPPFLARRERERGKAARARARLGDDPPARRRRGGLIERRPGLFFRRARRGERALSLPRPPAVDPPGDPPPRLGLCACVS